MPPQVLLSALTGADHHITVTTGLFYVIWLHCFIHSPSWTNQAGTIFTPISQMRNWRQKNHPMHLNKGDLDAESMFSKISLSLISSNASWPQSLVVQLRIIMIPRLWANLLRFIQCQPKYNLICQSPLTPQWGIPATMCFPFPGCCLPTQAEIVKQLFVQWLQICLFNNEWRLFDL